MPKTDTRQTVLRSLLFVALLLLAAGLIVFLKRSTDVPLTPDDMARRDSVRRMATPDTAVDHSLPVAAPDTVAPDAAPDTEDTRDPATAGYDDGYTCGLNDGINDDERAFYDESSQYPSAADRRSYADAYRRGYAAGFADGQRHKPDAVPDDDNAAPLTPDAATAAPEHKAPPTPKTAAPAEKKTAPPDKKAAPAAPR